MNYEWSQICFMSLPKNAHTSLAKMFPKNVQQFKASSNLSEFLKHGKHKYLKNNNRLVPYEFLYTSVRNPYSRFISSYEQCRLVYGYRNSIDFFIQDVKDGNLSGKSMWHSDVQTKHLILEDINFIVRVESFMDDVFNLCEMLDCTAPAMLHRNKRKPKIELSRNCRKLVEEVFKDDFDKLGYQRI